MRARPHSHPCADCHTPTDCHGDLERNYDGFPDVICTSYHLLCGITNHDFLCEACADARAQQVATEGAEV